MEDNSSPENVFISINVDKPIGSTSEVKMRSLDESPVGTWQHWLEKRPYNCSGRCPVCQVRMEAKNVDPDYKAKYSMGYRNFLNVLDLSDSEPKVKVFAFGNSISKQLLTLVTRKGEGDYRKFDFTIQKRRTGPTDMNVEYMVIFEDLRPLTKEETLLAETKHDLNQYVQPATNEQLKSVAAGVVPSTPSNTTEDQSDKVTKQDLLVFKALCEVHGLEPAHFGVDMNNPPAKKIVDRLIADLKSETK